MLTDCFTKQLKVVVHNHITKPTKNVIIWKYNLKRISHNMNYMKMAAKTEYLSSNWILHILNAMTHQYLNKTFVSWMFAKF
jgi:hypothetical protein